MDERARQQMFIAGFKDPGSALYKNMVKVLRDCQEADARARAASPYVSMPFSISAADQGDLELQFGVRVRITGGCKRAPLTDRVAGMFFLLEAAMTELAGSAGREVLLIDGDLMTVAACGLEGRVVERTFSTSRAVAGYHLEDELLHRSTTKATSKISSRADMLQRELIAGGGDHYSSVVRSDSAAVDAIVVNHLKTPVGPTQLAYLALRRKAVVYGCIPFQVDMLYRDSGSLECFPGEYYIDREMDSLTLLPATDATMSVSMPYTAWREIVHSNSVSVCGTEFLCEKYNSVRGMLYYTLTSINVSYEAPESLRTCFFDKSKLSVTEITFPIAKMSPGGVPIGWERRMLRCPTDRVEKVMSRLMCSSSNVILPSEAYQVLMDYNNTVVNTLDTAKLAIRMDEREEMDIACALALRANWMRDTSRKTFNSLLSAIRLRYSVKDDALYRLVYVAICAWWNKPDVRASTGVDQLPDTKAMDWLGNDFSILMKDADPWVEIEQVVGLRAERKTVWYSWMPRPASVHGEGWLKKVLARATSVVRPFQKSDEGEGFSSEASAANSESGKSKSSASVIPKLFGKARVKSAAAPVASTGESYVCQGEVVKVRAKGELTDLKKKLLDKMMRDQGGMRLPQVGRMHEDREVQGAPTVPHMPVVPVDPISSIQADLLMVNGGPFENLGPKAGYRIAELDVVKNVTGNFRINDAKREIPKDKWIRRAKVEAGVEGNRIQSQAATLGAMFKRNVGVPSNRGEVNLDAIADTAIDKMISSCYRNEWQDIVNKHVDAGMWEPNMADMENFLSNVDEVKARKMLEEFFVEGHVDLTKWEFMTKGTVKPSREAGAWQKIDHAQTILFLKESSANAMYSAMIRHFKECVDECLRPEVMINPQCSEEEHERWYNTLNSVRSDRPTHSYGSDIRCYDRSQEHVARRIHMRFYERHGLNRERLERWETMYGVKRAAGMMSGVILMLNLSGVSGVFDTIMRNAIVNWATVIVSGGIMREDIAMLDIKGDDMDAEFFRPIRVETTVEKMSLSFNLSAKFFTSEVRYCCKQFRVNVGGYWYFLSDPWPKVQSVAKPITMGRFEADLHERFVSLKADLRHYDNGTLVDIAAECAGIYYNSEAPLYGMARGLAALVEDEKKFANFFHPAERIN